MFLRQNRSKKTGRTYLSIVQGYRDTNGKIKHKTIKGLGYLDKLKKEHSDPIAHFTELAKIMDEERKLIGKITITFDMFTRLSKDETSLKNYGCLVYSKIYHELELDRFLNNARRHEKFTYNSEAIMRMLVYSRLLTPGSKREAVLNKEQFFDSFDFSLDDVYHALNHFHKISESVQKHLHEKIVEQYERKTDLVYYDVTNYYFETDKSDDFRKKGYSKEGRRTPIVQMGLLMDTKGMPIYYKMFPGNTHDSQTLMPIHKELKKHFEIKRLITVADKGLNSGDNIAFALSLKDGYIYSKSIRGASDEFKKWTLDNSDSSINNNSNNSNNSSSNSNSSNNNSSNNSSNNNNRDYRITLDSSGNIVSKIKSRVIPDAEIYVSVEQNGKKTKKKKIKIEQKQIVFYSEKYAKRAKHNRQEAVEKAMKMIDNPSKYRRSFDYGAAGYIMNLKIDKDTGEISNVEDTLLLDIAKIEEEEKYDGYYAIVTSELDDTDDHIVSMYKGLWRIEESFKISKSVLDARPIYLRTYEHINAHFLICFIALLITRVLEVRLDRKYPISRITKTIRNLTCCKVEQNIWLFNYQDEVSEHINAIFNTDFGRKYMTLQEIKSNLASSKL